ncbi:MAG: MoaD/ThiS family protein [Planctomycetota bacterium]
MSDSVPFDDVRRTMPRVVFTSNLKRHVDCPESVVAGETVREALDSVFEQQQRLRGYVLDDQQRLRTHMVIYLNGVPVKDRVGLSDAVDENSEIYVMQALSGG